jgi:hypothetical protein
MNGESFRRRAAARRQSAKVDGRTTTSGDNLETDVTDNMKENNAN